MDRGAALKLASQVDHIISSKGTRVVHVDLKREEPDEEQIALLLLGPTGNLRAPTLRRGRTLLVGFDEASYEKALL